MTDKPRFFQTHGLNEEEFRKTELEWSLLDEISARHIGMHDELQRVGTYISQNLPNRRCAPSRAQMARLYALRRRGTRGGRRRPSRRQPRRFHMVHDRN